MGSTVEWKVSPNFSTLETNLVTFLIQNIEIIMFLIFYSNSKFIHMLELSTFDIDCDIPTITQHPLLFKMY